MAIAVTLCAILALDRPQLRVCLWTCPFVLGSDSTGHGATLVATSRVAEVLLGLAIGALLAVISDPCRRSLPAGARPARQRRDHLRHRPAGVGARTDRKGAI